MSKLLDFLRIRIIGVVDGLVVINHLNTKGFTLPIVEFFLSLVGYDNARSLASFYTNDVIGYQRGVQHAFALPGFISGALYFGFVGIFISSIYISFMCCFCEKKCRLILSGNDKDRSKASIVVILSYIYINAVFAFLFEGNIDKIIAFAFPAAGAYFIGEIVNIHFAKSSHSKEFL